MHTHIAPNANQIGKIYGPKSLGPIKVGQNFPCFIVTRITKTKVIARRLEMEVLRQPIENGYFNQDNLGVMRIKTPIVMADNKDLQFQSHKISTLIDGIDVEMHYITRKNYYLHELDTSFIWHTLSSESSIFCPTGFV